MRGKSKTDVAIEKKQKESRIDELMKIPLSDLINLTSIKNVQFKKIDSNNIAMNLKRNKREICELIYYKELNE